MLASRKAGWSPFRPNAAMSIGLFLLTLCQRETSINGFQPPERLNYVQKSIPTGTSLWATSKNTNGHNDGDEPSTPKEPANLNLRKRRRRKDYPSFSYNVKTLSSKRKRAKIKKSMEDKIMMKYKGSGFEDVEFRKPPTVSIPDSNTAGTTLTDAVVLNFFGGFESGLGDIGTSAMRSRLRKNRSYARPQQFAIANITVPPSLSDLSYPPSSQIKGFWAGLSARILTGVIAYFVFPYGIIFLDTFVTMQPEDLDQITSKFGPGVSILYGTFVSLTLSILYNRVKNVQDAVARETAILNLVTRNLLSIFKNDRELAVEAAQCCADQVRTLVRSSRGAELMFIMYSDPYARILECLQNKEEQLYEEKGNFGSQGNLFAFTRDSMKDLIRMRAERLSVEALSLPPTHFQILNLLTLLILLSFTVSILPTIDRISGAPPTESSLLFAILTNIYVLFYFFAQDLNDPFDGVYQIRRSSSASKLLETKWLIANHPLLQGEVDFEDVEEDPEGTCVWSPGLGEMCFYADELFVDGKTESVENE